MSIYDEAGVIPALEDYFAQFPNDRHPLLFESGSVQKTSRRIIKYGPRNHHVGYFFSRKNNCQIQFESTIERDACLLFESLPGVRHYLSQPAPISYLLNGRRRKTTPDFELICEGRREYVEVKPEAKTQTAAFRARVAAIQASGALKGRAYRVLTDTEIRGPELPQIAALYQQARWSVRSALTSLVAAWLTELPEGVQYAEVLKRLRSYPIACCALDGMILDGVIAMDLSIPLAQQPVYIDAVPSNQAQGELP